MNDFSKLTEAELEALRKSAEENLELIKNARHLKDRSKGVLADFQKEIDNLAQGRLSWTKKKVQRSYGTTEDTEVLLSGGGNLNEHVKRFLNSLAFTSDNKPFGLVPMSEFWREWATAVDTLTKLMVGRYLTKYVMPYPTDNAENVRAFKVGDAFAEAAKDQLTKDA